ncbi:MULTISPECIES: flagellar filament capping protein FliD [Lysinibacillus]|uniref:flagellar filament capping protein FliD n=1 Tax=Lysinibacillus TaxID=400634 RepID=UPI00257D140C|nr:MULTISPECIES: flagellar filament capping protein FliD [Lysinibacillus]
MVSRIGGLASGMDIDSIVEKLMKAERMPLNKAFQRKQTFEWQRDAYRNVNTTLRKLEDFLKTNMFLQSQMMKKTATSSNEKLVSVNATNSATGSLNIESVTQLATATQLIGKQTQYTGNTKLSELGISGTSLDLSSIDKNGDLAAKPTTISFDPNKDTVNDLVKKINESKAGVTALFENGKLSLTANNTGSVKSGTGEIVFGNGKGVFDALGFANDAEVTKRDGKNAILQVNGISMERSSNKVTISGYEITLKETFNAYSGALERQIVAKEERDNAESALNGAGGLKDRRNVADSTYNNYYNDTFKDAYEALFGTNGLTVDQQTKFKGLSNVGQVARLDASDLQALRSLGITDFSNEANVKAIISNDTNGLTDDQRAKLLANSKDLEALNSSDGDALLERAKQVDFENLYKSLDKKFLSELSTDDINFLASIKGKNNAEIDAAFAGTTEDIRKKFGGIDRVDLGQLADLADDGNLEKFKSFYTIDKQNQDNLSALTAAKNAVTAGEKRLAEAEKSLKNANDAVTNTPNDTSSSVVAVSLNSTVETSAIKDRIKEFVTNYNEMLDTLNGLLKEKKYRDFPPLTKEQREDMSENEQKLWDEKAKSGLLRSDSLIREGLSKMRTQFMSSVNGLGDKTIDALAEIGITTSNKLSESGKLVIVDEKLDAALEKDPQQVVELFTKSGTVTTTYDADKKRNVTEDSRGITKRLRDEIANLTKSIEKKAGRDGDTEQSYNIGKNIVDMDNRITKLQAKLKDIEARYWKQFTAMEQAINKANQQSGMFMQGGGF